MSDMPPAAYHRSKSGRVQARPDPEAWDLDELLTLTEAVELHWPNGPITVPTLRTAIRDGQLPVCVVAGKFFTTRRILKSLATGRLRATKPDQPFTPSPGTPRGGMSDEEACELLGLRPGRSR